MDASRKRRGYIYHLSIESRSQHPGNLWEVMSDEEAGAHIGRLKRKKEEREHKQAERRRERKPRARAAKRAALAERGASLKPGVRRGRVAIDEAAPWKSRAQSRKLRGLCRLITNFGYR